MRVLCLLALAGCAFALSGCGGSATDRVVSVSLQLGAPSGPTVLVASLRPIGYRGLGRVLPISAVRSDLPSRLPVNVPQPVGRGINRFVVVRLASGKTITYGPLASPPAITRLVGAMWAADRSGLAIDSPAEARSEAKQTLSDWLSELKVRAQRHPAARFRNLSRPLFLSRLHQLAARYHFRVVRARILQPVQDAPLVIVQTSDPQAFVHAVPSIQHLLDPKQRTNDDRTGWAYEGFYLGALDIHGTPFLSIFNYWRGPRAGGGQWAARESLFPYPHG